MFDEVQCAPDWFPAPKRQVDRNPAPDRFLLTGSAPVFMRPKAAESLAGRIAVLMLAPLSPAATAGSPHKRR